MKIHKKERWFKIIFHITPLEVDPEGNYQVNHGYNHHHDYHVVKVFDLPDWIYFKHRRHMNIFLAKLKINNTNFEVDSLTHPYYRAGDKKGDVSAARSVASLKGQVTKVENAIAAYEKDMKMRLIWEPENDSQYQRALAKLAQKKKNLKEAIQELKKTEQ